MQESMENTKKHILEFSGKAWYKFGFQIEKAQENEEKLRSYQAL